MRYMNRGAVLVLLWTLLPYSLSAISNTFINAYIGSNLVYAVVAPISISVFGCLSDMLLGRYTIIRYSLWLLWISLIVTNVLMIVKPYTAMESRSLEWTEYLVAGCTVIGMCGVLVNTMQFGIDQLIDASSSQICSFISWYVWIVSLTSTLSSLTQYCFCGSFEYGTAFYFFPLLCSGLVLSDIFLKNLLLKEPPVNTNPFKLIFQVLRYALKNKYPRLRSAFTYWDDKPYSRIDLGKTKYGGPFTTEQVEDVKTFFRVTGAILLCGPLSSVMYFVSAVYSTAKIFEFKIGEAVVKRCDDAIGVSYMEHCYRATVAQHLPNITIVIFVPVLEFVLYPLFVRCHCCRNIRILDKLSLGVFFVLIYESCFLVEKVAFAFSTGKGNSTCFLTEESKHKSEDEIWSDYKYYLFPQPVFGAALYLVFTSAIEFVCAQSPYSMKGLLIGMFFVLQALSLGLSDKLLEWMVHVISNVRCGIWLHTGLTGALVVIFAPHVMISRCYKLRKRDEILSNEQVFAVDYFEKYLPPNSNSRLYDNSS